MTNFTDRLVAVQQRKHTVVCVGLDPDPDLLPQASLQGRPLPAAVEHFCRSIIEATADSTCAFKVNLAFFEVLGEAGYRTLAATLRSVPSEIITIADAKRGDIGNSARFYAKALFEDLGCDACTVAPYMGRDSVEPFLQYPGRAAFVLARTSNPGAADFQEVACGEDALYRKVARSVSEWDVEAPGQAGLVVGATGGGALAQLRALCPTLPFLIPGVGAQGGDIDDVLSAATAQGRVIVNSSRQILYASSEDDFAAAAGRAAEQLRRTLEVAAS